jgi:hypothetical protein
VGLANGRNPISIVVPCHRVIGADGSLTGYGGGLDRKTWLLRHEGIALAADRISPQGDLFASRRFAQRPLSDSLGGEKSLDYMLSIGFSSIHFWVRC